MAKSKKPEMYAVHNCDCVQGMQQLTDNLIPLIFADCPYNIGRKYENYDDKRPRDEYLKWAETWLRQIHRVLHKHGTFWLAIHDSLVSEMDVLCKSIGFHKRSHVVWSFTFGVNCAQNFTKSHTHLLYYTKTKSKYTFNADDPDLRVPSARQLIYNDKRANPKGRLPDDIWILRPGELAEFFKGHSDTWLVSRICGTFKERVEGADNQIPLPIMERIIRATSKPGDLVMDPFSGTGSTGVAAVSLGRQYIGYEISATMFAKSRDRISKARPVELPVVAKKTRRKK